MAERPMNQEPISFSQADFLDAVAQEAQVDPSELSQRSDPIDRPDDLLAIARQAVAERRPMPSNIESLERELNLHDQYEEQLQVLERTSLIGRLPGGELAVHGIDGCDYAAPTYEQLQAAVAEKIELLERKAEQGFTKLLLVPFSRALDDLRSNYGRALVNHAQNNQLNDTSGNPLDLDLNNPVYTWSGWNDADRAQKLVYYPDSFDQNHGGLTKQDILSAANSPIPGWEIVLVEDLPDLSASGAGIEIGGRKQHEAGLAANSYKFIMNTSPEYEGESGMTPEAWITYAATNLDQDHVVVDDFAGKGKATYLMGAYFPGDGLVPNAYWDRDNRQAYLNAIEPDFPNANIGVRSAVRVA